MISIYSEYPDAIDEIKITDPNKNSFVIEKISPETLTKERIIPQGEGKIIISIPQLKREQVLVGYDTKYWGGNIKVKITESGDLKIRQQHRPKFD